MKPLIGLTTCSSMFGGSWTQPGPGQFMDYMFRDYVQSVETAGGLPVGIPITDSSETIAGIVDRIDGLLVTGGDDICPLLYGEEPLPELKDGIYELDLMEKQAVARAHQRGIPILGICRGMQLINAALGGTLYQDIYSQREGCLGHNQKQEKHLLCHHVHLREGTRLHGIIGQRTIKVNSQHHQAVKQLAPGFVATAEAADGVIEGMEHTDSPYLVGVQWHPEGTWRDDEPSQKIFASLVAAAQG